VVTAIVFIIIAYWFFRSPLCAALADSIKATTAGGPVHGRRVEAAVERLAADVEGLRGEVLDLAERLDFTERMLVDVRERMALPTQRG
jgi:hypothetical protein